MARPRDTTRPRSVGIAIGTPALRRAVVEVLEKSRYEPVVFEASDVAQGIWPRGRHAAIVATPHAFRARQRATRRRPGSPLILIVSEGALAREHVALGAADSFVLVQRLHTLPSIMLLAAHRLAIMPRPKGRPAIRKK